MAPVVSVNYLGLGFKVQLFFFLPQFLIYICWTFVIRTLSTEKA